MGLQVNSNRTPSYSSCDPAAGHTNKNIEDAALGPLLECLNNDTTVYSVLGKFH